MCWLTKSTIKKSEVLNRMDRRKYATAGYGYGLSLTAGRLNRENSENWTYVIPINTNTKTCFCSLIASLIFVTVPSKPHFSHNVLISHIAFWEHHAACIEETHWSVWGDHVACVGDIRLEKDNWNYRTWKEETTKKCMCCRKEQGHVEDWYYEELYRDRETPRMLKYRGK